MDKLIEQANNGKKYWIENCLDRYDNVLLLPHEDERLNKLLCKILEKKIRGDLSSWGQSQYKMKAIILSAGKIEESRFYVSRTISVEDVESLIYLYCMYEFTDKLIIGSLEVPHGRKIKNLVECGICSEEELLEVIIFGN